MERTGAYLRAEREKQHKELRDMARATCISATTLRAIENGTADFLPPQAYIRGFLRAYARELDLDPEDVVHMYDAELKDGYKWVPHKELKHRSGSVSFITPKRLLVLFSALVLPAIALVFFFGSQSEKAATSLHSTPHPEATVLPETEISVPETMTNTAEPQSHEHEPQSDASEPENLTLPAGSAGPDVSRERPAPAFATAGDVAVKPRQFTVRFEARELVWMKLAPDESPAFEVTLRRGESFSQSAERILKVRIGNSGGVAVFYNGRPLSLRGKHGIPVDITFPYSPQGGEDIQ